MEYSATLVRAKDKTENTEIVTGSVDKQDANSPAYECMSYREQIGDVVLARMVHGGTKTMRNAKEDVLPMHPMEQRKEYESRIKIAVAHNALRETVSGLVGMLFRKDPTYSEDMPKIVQGDEAQTGHVSDIDRQGNALPVFARNVADNAMTDGHTWIHIDSPPRDPNVRNRAEERARPYWINVLKAQAHNWQYDVRDGRPVLTLFAYHESAVEGAGAFGEVERKRIRVLREVSVTDDKGVVTRPVRGELWEFVAKNEDTGKAAHWQRIDEYPVESEGIPVVCVYANKTGTFASSPPLLDVAYEQIEHFRVRSERQKALSFSAVSVPYLFSAHANDDGKVPVQWGHGGMMIINDADAQTGVIESSGNGLTALKEELGDIEARMTKPGLRMMRKVEGVQAQTATSEILQKAQGDASLVLFAVLLEDALNQAFGIHASYRADIDVPGSVALNRDFHESLLSPEHMRIALEASDKGRLSLYSWLTMLKDGEIMPDSFSVEEEIERIDSESARSLEATTRAMFPAGQDEPDSDEDDDELEPAA